jgi:hypothetical protein
LTSLLALGLVWAVVRRPVVVALPSATATARSAPGTVRVAVDSDPQGASVTTPAVRDGARLGDTPLVVELPRADVAVDVTFAKPGFLPLVYRVIPHQDRDVAVRLERVGPVAPAPQPAPLARASSPRAGARHLAQRASSPANAAAPNVSRSPSAPVAAASAPNTPAARPAAAAAPQRPAWSAPIPRR